VNHERIAQLVERAPVAFEALRGMADTLTSLEVKRAGFEPTDEELDAMLYFWWTASCNENLGVAATAVSMLEDFADMGREEDGDAEEERVWEAFSGVVKLLARAARQNGYA
jgi:hypothetical protein